MNVKIELTYITPKGTETSFISDWMRAGKAQLIVEDLERTGRIKSIMFTDDHGNTWTMKELKKYMAGIETEAHNVTVYFDGGFDIKTKTSGLGCAIYYEKDNKKFRHRINALVEGLQTNNEAEYAAFHLGVQELELLGVHHMSVTFIGDSQVVINQLKGEWACYEKELSKWADRIEDQLQKLGIQVIYELIARKENGEADQLASQALRKIEITSTSEVTQQ